MQAKYTLNDDGSVRVDNSMIRLLRDEKERTHAFGNAKISFPKIYPTVAKLNVTFSPFQPNQSNYWVVATDYKHYSIVYSCLPVGERHSAFGGWVLSRTPVLDASVVDVVNAAIDKYFDRSEMRTTDQDAQRLDILLKNILLFY